MRCHAAGAGHGPGRTALLREERGLMMDFTKSYEYFASANLKTFRCGTILTDLGYEYIRLGKE